MTKTWLALALAAAGCMTSPTNGQITDKVVAKQFNFGGKVNQPNMPIEVQIQNSPQEDPADDKHWTTIATAVSNATPDEGNWNSEMPIYGWSVSVTPFPTAASRGVKWKEGGLARFRAVHRSPDDSDPDSDDELVPLATFDEANYNCLVDQINAGTPWDGAGAKCEGMAKRTAVYVDTSRTPTPQQGYLTAKGVGNAGATQAYYTFINAPTTLGNFRQQFGFNNAPASVVHARYFNDADLGLGREMNCKSFGTIAGPGVACYVRNYGAVAGKGPKFDDTLEPISTVLAQTIAAQHPFATVAMVYRPPSSNANSVQFMVYDAAGSLTNDAKLDAAGDNKSIPQNCLSCHGIDATAGAVVSNKAEFLPFDPYAFQFYPNAPWRRPDQQEAFRKLNQLVLLADPPAATTELIAGMYATTGGVNTSGATATNDFVPTAWWKPSDSTFDGKTLYNGLIKPYCRTCHVSSNKPGLDFNTRADFDYIAPKILTETCNLKRMPHAERVMKKFFASGARAYIVTGMPIQFPEPLMNCTP